MFKEFNVKFEDAEIIGGADNLLEGTGVTKVILRGDNKMSSLDSTFKNCSDLDNIQGGLDLNGVNDIDNILEGNSLIKSIDLKNINNENITANNSFPNVEEINISGELYNKKAIQNVIASKEWTFDNIKYKDIAGDNVITKEVNVIDNNQITIKDTLERKAKGIEIVGQTYENLAKGKGEYNLTDTYSATWTESNNSFENMPNVIEISEIYGNTVQDESDLSIIQSVGDLYVDEEGSPILDEEGNEQYKLEIESYGYGNTPSSSNKTTILMPQPLRRIRGYSPQPYYKTDRLYWDNEKGSYFIEKNIDTGVVDLSSCTVNWSGYNSPKGYYDMTFNSKTIYDNIKSKFTIRDTNICMIGTGFILTTPYWLEYQNNGNFKPSECISFKYSNNSLQYRTTNTNLTSEDLTEIFRSKSPIIVYGGLNTPQTIETKILEKPSLETYFPTTYISTNTEIQPSQMIITNKNALINLEELNNNTDYTIQFKCNYKGDKPIKFNLCGSEKEVDAVLGVNHINITTPNELSDSKLELSGAGNKISDIMLIEGDMKQYPNYFDGIKSVGVLQDDNTYKIDIETSSSVGDNLLSYSNFVSGHLLNGNVVSPGATITHTESSLTCNTNGISWRGCSSNYVEIDPTKKYFYEYTTSVSSSSNWYSNVSFYDKYKVYISNITTSGWIPIPNNAKYLKVCYQLGLGGTFTISNMRLFTPTTFKVSVQANSPLAKGDKLYWNDTNKRYKIDRNGVIEIPTAEGDVIDLPRLYQRTDTVLTVNTGNIKPSEIKIKYKDLN